MLAKHTWTFKASLRTGAFGWHGSRLACRRLKEAVAEIGKVAKVDAVTAGDRVVSLLERIWPACEHIDTSSGALGSAVYWTLSEVLPIVIEAPADRKTRDQWLVRLWQAIQADGVDYLLDGRRSVRRAMRFELCGLLWADELLEPLRSATGPTAHPEKLLGRDAGPGRSLRPNCDPS